MTVYYLNSDEVTEAQLELWEKQMSDEKRLSVSAMKNEKKRKLRIMADSLCRNAIGQICGASDVELAYDKLGKPFAKGLPVHFSVSHSGNYAVCAVSDSEIGIDIEKIRPINHRTAERFATEGEKKYISTKPDAFFEIWTLKEAYFKCIGTGLGADIKNVSFKVENGSVTCSEEGFDLLFHEIDSGYICSICKKRLVR